MRPDKSRDAPHEIFRLCGLTNVSAHKHPLNFNEEHLWRRGALI